MSGKIRVLDEGTINQIAAGEVIENPASVVKELVENSLDAGSQDISVEILEGGRQLIRITDDGCGMIHDDAILCLERHATSKIRKLEDIYGTYSMGFRGEAIPSIAAISKFTLITTPQSSNDQEGTMVIVEGGKLLKVCKAARSPGTTIEIKSLFFNVPVRRKFQKSPSYDQSEIVKMMTKLALGHPTIRFQLISDYETIFSTQAPLKHKEEQLSQRIEELLGKEFHSTLIPVQNRTDTHFLSGYIASPEHHRPNRTGQYLFINGRAVVSPFISQAIKEGFGTTLPPNRHPQFVLYLSIPSDLVDVNVHPQKHEVRLREESTLHARLIQEIEQSLQIQNPVPAWDPPVLESVVPEFQHSWTPAPLPETSKASYNPSIKTEPFQLRPRAPSVREVQEQPYLGIIEKSPPPRTIRLVASLPGFLLGDRGTIEHPEIVLIDLRGAHMRILYEKLEQREQISVSQTLLIPLTLEFNQADTVILREYLSELNQMGISIREFGSHTFIVDALPSLFSQSDAIEKIKELIDSLRGGISTRISQEERSKIVVQAASKIALPNGKKLSNQEAHILLQQLLQCKQPLQCPRGKSIIAILNPDYLSLHF